ncbi:hypothetical protein Syun_001962 [Stephania yunnanensis]|uniref:Protein kinase domain-containing protein n=1 Tax=Stephania yunnanensis TaxID=152371 RepID=A0AAP0Q6S7_9MAGN
MGYLSCKAESSVLTSPDPDPDPDPTIPTPPIKLQQFKYTDLEAATSGFSEQKLLGKGSHGSVYKGVLRSGRLVAVKKPSYHLSNPTSLSFHKNNNNSNNNEVDNEIDILSKIHSPRLVNLLGFTHNSPNQGRLLVVEFMSNGTLYESLHLNPRPPNWGRRIRFALQTAKAIHTLHSSNPPVIHRDIKSANVLLDRNYNARLGDFGLALRCDDDDIRRLRSTPPAGTIGYLDPGYVTPDNLCTRTDVFSFGILLLEIISGRKAIDVSHSPPSIVDWAIPFIRRGKLLSIYDPRIDPPKDPSVRKQLAVMAAKCVRSSSERRPSMKDVVEGLTVLSKFVPVNAWNGFSMSMSNPCMMVDAVGRPVEAGTAKLRLFRDRGEDHGDESHHPMRNSRRVYSDLGVGGRSNLMDLLAEADGEASFAEEGRGDDEVDCESLSIQASSLRIGRRRLGGEQTNKSLDKSCDGGDNLWMRRNQSVRGNPSKPMIRHGRLYSKDF